MVEVEKGNMLALYWLIDEIGPVQTIKDREIEGRGWTLLTTDNAWYFSIDDENQAIMFALRWR